LVNFIITLIVLSVVCITLNKLKILALFFKILTKILLKININLNSEDRYSIAFNVTPYGSLGYEDVQIKIS